LSKKVSLAIEITIVVMMLAQKKKAAEELYVPGHSMQESVNILENNMKPIYDAAKYRGMIHG